WAALIRFVPVVRISRYTRKSPPPEREAIPVGLPLVRLLVPLLVPCLGPGVVALRERSDRLGLDLQPGARPGRFGPVGPSVRTEELADGAGVAPHGHGELLGRDDLRHDSRIPFSCPPCEGRLVDAVIIA